MLNDGLPAEQVERHGAEEHRDALLVEEMQIHQLGQRTREIRLQQLHASTSDRSAGLEKGKKNKNNHKSDDFSVLGASSTNTNTSALHMLNERTGRAASSSRRVVSCRVVVFEAVRICFPLPPKSHSRKVKRMIFPFSEWGLFKS